MTAALPDLAQKADFDHFPSRDRASPRQPVPVIDSREVRRCATNVRPTSGRIHGRMGQDFMRCPKLTTLAGVLLAAALHLPASRAAAQAVHIVHLSQVNGVGQTRPGSTRLRFEPWGGVLFDAYRNDGGDGRPAWIGAVRLGYELGSGLASAGRGWRVFGEIARAEAAEAGTAVIQDSLTVVFRSEWWLATAGAEWDVVSGWTGLTLEAGAGAAWLQREIVAGDPIPPGAPGTTERADSEPFPAFVVGLSGYRHLSHRIQLRLRVEDVVTDLFEAAEHSPAVGIGFRFVFE